MKILLTTLHARYVHASLALPCLAVACRNTEAAEIVIREYSVNEPHHQLLRCIYNERANLVMFSCYIWNVEQTLKLASDLKQAAPRTFIVLGGPEVSYGAFELITNNPAIDCIVRGEGEETCRKLVSAMGSGHPLADQLGSIQGLTFRDGEHITATPDNVPIADLDTIPSPLAAGLTDLSKPLVYHETSRGCPFSCAFCVSSIGHGVRSFSPARIRNDLALLMDHGVQTIKLVDRTFNYDADRANDIWSFILEHNRNSRFHFEIAADLLTDANIRLLAQVPPDRFRFEIGVQSMAPETLQRVGRSSDLKQLFANIERLKRETAVTLHLDLVAGLPEEDFAGFTASLQRLLDAEPHHIQVEPLKVLKGTPMRVIAREEQYAFSDAPPYRILRTPWLSFEDISRIETISRLLDLIYNSGRFRTTLHQLAETMPLARLFHELAQYWDREALPSALPLQGLFSALWNFGSAMLKGEQVKLHRDALSYDFCLADYPITTQMPEFFTAKRGEGKKGLSRELLQELGIGGEAKVRSYSSTFPRDYRAMPWEEGETELLFVYISASGKGQMVRVLKGN